MDSVEQLGAFLGLAAFFALAIVSLLVFQLARDVRRLRDWAGRAPERAAIAADRASQDYSEQAQELRNVRREAEGDTFWHTRNVAIAAVGAVIFGLGVFVAIANIGGGDKDRDGGATQERGQGGPGSKVVPGTVRVAVLNGTAVPGLAASVGDTVEENGFQLGTVTNSDQSFELSYVMYESGHKREADAVAKAIGFGRVKAANGQIKGIAGGANVIAIVGRDRAAG